MATINGSMVISPAMSGTIIVGYYGNGWVATTHLYLSGTGLADGQADVSIAIPRFVLNADGIVSNTGIVSVSVPACSLSARGILDIIGVASLTLPRLRLTTEDLLSVQGALTKSLPFFTLSATVLRGAVGSLDQDIPPFTISAEGRLDITGIGAISLPAFMLSVVLSPQSYLNMVLNIRNRALTLYGNYDFNSMCRFNGVHLGATSTNIYDLNSGDTDAGTLIEWNFRTGYLDLHQKEKKKLRQAWVSYKSDGDIIVTVVTADGTEYEYCLEGVEVTEDGIRVKVGRGIKSKYVALDVQSDGGSSIALDAIKLHFEKIGLQR
jgi:hypothetical protein